MNSKQNGVASSSLNLGDIYYIFFRHKWKILLIITLGLAAAASVYFFWPTPYGSEAKLYIRYVVETKNPAQMGQNDPRIKSPDDRGGESIINTELEILTSLDLAQQVADAIGPERILGQEHGGTNRFAAAGIIRKNLIPEVGRRSSVIRLVFKHPDAAVVQPVLSQVIDTYLKRHAEIHRAVGLFDDFLTQQTDQLRARLLQTEDELRKTKNKAGVIYLDDTRKGQAEQMSRIQQAILDAEAELAERQAAAAEIAKTLPAVEQLPATNQVASTNDFVVPPEKLAEYQRVSGFLEMLIKREQELLVTFTPENSRVKTVRDQIAATEQQKLQLEAETPGLVAVRLSETRTAAGAAVADPREKLVTELARVTALGAKIQVLTGQLEKVREQATMVGEMEGTITDLQRKKELEESQYRYYQQNLEQARIDEQLGVGRNTNISKIQAPSPPFRDIGNLYKILAAIVFGSVAAAFGLAFVIETYLDRSLKRSIDVERRVALPLFMTIPALGRITKARRLKPGQPVPLLAATNPSNGKSANSTNGVKVAGKVAQMDIVPWDSRHVLRPYFEALRDRLINYFEVHNLTHKPKLVAVTSCGEGAGVSTSAAGLAASLSETGEGNVLLVDMNVQDGAAHQFYQGELTCLEDALEADKRDQALVQENLYVVSRNRPVGREQLPAVLPKRFKHLVPRLRASDYDYIIFDMPPVSQISLTPRLAKFMDIVLMVVESGKTDTDVVKRASALLAESQAKVGIVLNKERTYVPKRLHQEF